VHRKAEQRGEHAHFDHHPKDRLGGRFRNARLGVGAARVQFHDAGGIRNRLDSGQGEHHSDEAAPVLPKPAGQRPQIVDGIREMGHAEQAEQYDDDDGRDGHKKRQSAGVLRTEDIQSADDGDRQSREQFRVRHPEIVERGKRADGGGHDIIRRQKEGADDGDDFGPMPHAGIDPAAIGIMLADRHVVDAHQGGEQAHGGDEPERAVAGDGKRQPDDIGFAGAPVAVENGRRPRGIHVARPFRVARNHCPTNSLSAAAGRAEYGRRLRWGKGG